MASDQQIREFLSKWDGVQETDEGDLLALIRGWEAQVNHLEEFVLGVHEDLLTVEDDGSNLAGDDGNYYRNAVTKYAVNQDNEALSQAAALLEQNIRESYIDDGMLRDLCFEVVAEQVGPAVIPDDGP